jgi:hypothetical protein
MFRSISFYFVQLNWSCFYSFLGVGVVLSVVLFGSIFSLLRFIGNLCIFLITQVFLVPSVV